MRHADFGSSLIHCCIWNGSSELFADPIQRSDTEHPFWNDVHHPYTLLHCNDAIFPDLGQNLPVSIWPFSSVCCFLPLRKEKAFLWIQWLGDPFYKVVNEFHGFDSTWYLHAWQCDLGERWWLGSVVQSWGWLFEATSCFDHCFPHMWKSLLAE